MKRGLLATILFIAASTMRTPDYQADYNYYEIEGGLLPDVSNLTTVEYNTLLAGVAWGFLGKEGCNMIQTCMKDAAGEGKEVFLALEDLIHGNWTVGILELVNVIKTLPTVFGDCKSIGPDLLILENWALVLEQQHANLNLENWIRNNIIVHTIGLTRDLN